MSPPQIHFADVSFQKKDKCKTTQTNLVYSVKETARKMQKTAFDRHAKLFLEKKSIHLRIK